MAKEEILIEWRDSRENRRRVARQWLRIVLQVWAETFVLAMVTAVGIPWFISLYSPGVDDMSARLWAQAFYVVRIFLLFGVPTTILVCGVGLLLRVRYALCDEGLKIGDHLCRWDQLVGYRLDEKANEHGERVISVLTKGRILPPFREIPVPGEIPIDYVLQIFSSHLPVTQEEDLWAKAETEVKSPRYIVFVVGCGVAAGLILGMFDSILLPMVMFLVLSYIGPGTWWFLVKYPVLVRKPLLLLQMDRCTNRIAALVMMPVWMYVRFYELVNHVRSGMH